MKKTSKINLITFSSFLSIIFIFLHCTSAYSATFTGKVIDADTKQPIEGAVAVASWIGEQGGAAGGDSRLGDVKETLTDKNGEWIIKGPKGNKNLFIQGIYSFLTFFTHTYYTMPPQFIIYKPGYCSWPKGFEIEACKGKILYETTPEHYVKIGDGETIGLPRLISREDRRRNSSISLPLDGNATFEKSSILKSLLDEEDRTLGEPNIKH